MSYAPKRPHISKKTKQFIYDRDGGVCYLCGLPIGPDEPFDADHEIARELGGSDGVENLRPAHRACHRQKTKSDVKAIAKSNRIRRANGPAEQRRKTPHPIRTRKTNWPKRTFQRREPK